MTTLKVLSDQVSVSPQLRPEAASALAEAGTMLLINNRPDGEQADQPTAAEMEAAARAAGLEYRHIPIQGMPSPDAVEAFGGAVQAANGPVVAFCRSGMRSTVIWALAQSAQGQDPDSIRQAAFEAGYDLSGLPL